MNRREATMEDDRNPPMLVVHTVAVRLPEDTSTGEAFNRIDEAVRKHATAARLRMHLVDLPIGSSAIARILREKPGLEDNVLSGERSRPAETARDRKLTRFAEAVVPGFARLSKALQAATQGGASSLSDFGPGWEDGHVRSPASIPHEVARDIAWGTPVPHESQSVAFVFDEVDALHPGVSGDDLSRVATPFRSAPLGHSRADPQITLVSLWQAGRRHVAVTVNVVLDPAMEAGTPPEMPEEPVALIADIGAISRSDTWLWLTARDDAEQRRRQQTSRHDDLTSEHRSPAANGPRWLAHVPDLPAVLTLAAVEDSRSPAGEVRPEPSTDTWTPDAARSHLLAVAADQNKATPAREAMERPEQRVRWLTHEASSELAPKLAAEWSSWRWVVGLEEVNGEGSEDASASPDAMDVAPPAINRVMSRIEGFQPTERYFGPSDDRSGEREVSEIYEVRVTDELGVRMHWYGAGGKDLPAFVSLRLGLVVYGSGSPVWYDQPMDFWLGPGPRETRIPLGSPHDFERRLDGTISFLQRLTTDLRGWTRRRAGSGLSDPPPNLLRGPQSARDAYEAALDLTFGTEEAMRLTGIRAIPLGPPAPGARGVSLDGRLDPGGSWHVSLASTGAPAVRLTVEVPYVGRPAIVARENAPEAPVVFVEDGWMDSTDAVLEAATQLRTPGRIGIGSYLQDLELGAFPAGWNVTVIFGDGGRPIADSDFVKVSSAPYRQILREILGSNRDDD